MSLIILFRKIWLYLGPFYLSLIALIIFSFLTKKKKIFIYLFIIINLFFSFDFYIKMICSLPGDFNYFLLHQGQKKNLVNSKQLSFLEEIKDSLPNTKTICYPWPSDIAGRYAQQFLYPRRVILAENNIKRCDFLVLDYSTGIAKYQLEDQLTDKDKQMFSSKTGKVFQIWK